MKSVKNTVCSMTSGPIMFYKNHIRNYFFNIKDRVWWLVSFPIYAQITSP
jgi:hypothetical protein